MPESARRERLERELGSARQRRDALAYEETQGILSESGQAELAAIRETEIPELEGALAEAKSESLTGDGEPRP